MNLRHLRFFVVVAEELNFTRAADRLNVAQPALSYQIRSIEHRIGAQLIDRSSRPMRLTPAGQYFFSEARRLLAEYENAASSARQIATGQRDWLGIGFTRSAIYSVLPPALKTFHLVHPNVELKLFEMLTEEQADALEKRRIHVGIGRNVLAISGYTNTVLLREQPMVAVPLDSPMATKPRVQFAELGDLPLILYPKHPAAQYPLYVETIFRDAGFVPTVSYRVHEMQTALALVAAGLGITVVGESVARQGRSDIAYRMLQGAGPNPLTSLTATSRTNDDSATLQVFLRMLPAAD